MAKETFSENIIDVFKGCFRSSQFKERKYKKDRVTVKMVCGGDGVPLADVVVTPDGEDGIEYRVSGMFPVFTGEKWGYRFYDALVGRVKRPVGNRDDRARGDVQLASALVNTILLPFAKGMEELGNVVTWGIPDEYTEPKDLMV